MHTPEPKPVKLARVAEFQQSIANAMVGHAALLYETRCTLLSAVTEEREGYHLRFVRFTNPACKECRGVGITYGLDQAHCNVLIEECECVQYEAQYSEIKDPDKENVDGKAKGARVATRTKSPLTGI